MPSVNIKGFIANLPRLSEKQITAFISKNRENLDPAQKKEIIQAVLNASKMTSEVFSLFGFEDIQPIIKDILPKLGERQIIDYVSENKPKMDSRQVEEVRQGIQSAGKVSRAVAELFKVGFEELKSFVNEGNPLKTQHIKGYLKDGNIDESEAKQLLWLTYANRLLTLTLEDLRDFEITKEDLRDKEVSKEELKRLFSEQGAAKEFGLTKQELTSVWDFTEEEVEEIIIPEPIFPPRTFDPNAAYENMRIDEDCTDVILLGVSQSGKTILLSSLLHEAYKDAELRKCEPNTRVYYEFLATVPEEERFIGERTARDFAVSIPINIDKKTRKQGGVLRGLFSGMGKQQHLITPLNIMELAGEDFEKMEDGIHIPAPYQKVFASNNQKMLFFVLDYDICLVKGSDEPHEQYGDMNARKQINQLNAAFSVLRNHDVFKRCDFINLVITKWDKSGGEYNHPEEFLSSSKNSILESIVNSIKRVVTENKQLIIQSEIFDFSVGTPHKNEVSFEYKPESGRKILEYIVNHSAHRSITN